MVGRLAKITICLALGAFAGLVALDNLVDYGTNYAFVQHVLTMDTTHPGNALMGRAVTDPALWRAAYGLIILGEGLTAILFLAGAGALSLRLHGPAAAFHRAKGWVYAAGATGFCVWFIGFTLIGGEWFQMWQSAHWNGQQPAFEIVVTILAALIFIAQPDETLLG